MAHFSLKEKNGISYLIFDTPDKPVNVLSKEALVELQDILKSLAKDDSIRALLIKSAKEGIFIAGADINEIQGIETAEEGEAAAKSGQDIFNLLEDLPFPTIALINGVTLGGGLELSMACSYRIACSEDSVKIGLPEVKLGIIPGFGGTVRMPALIGIEQSIGLICAGKVIDAYKAYKLGLVDDVCSIHLLEERALALLESKDYKKPRLIRRSKLTLMEKIPGGKGLIHKIARDKTLKQTKGHYPAPVEAIDSIIKNDGKSRKEAMRIEAQIFGSLIRRKTHKGLIRVFHLTEKYKKEKWVEAKSIELKKIGVVGAGVMGGGIAQTMVQYNLPVRLKDVGEEALRLGLSSASRVFQGMVKKRRMKPTVAHAHMHLISPTLDYTGFESCSVIVEAVVEKLAIKKSVFKELEGIVASTTVLATNTSAIPITEIAADMQHPERAVGMHFFNPVHRMPLVEIIRGEKTNDESVAAIVALCKRIRKTAVVVKDSPGFLVNRLLMPYLNEAGHMFCEGYSFEAMDKDLFDFGMPMGAFVLLDEIGLDVSYKVALFLEQSFGERMKVSSVLKEMCDKGWLGKKSGKGFYIHEGRNRKPNPEMQSMQAAAKTTTAEKTVERCIHVMINEAALCLEENVCRSAADIDIGMIMGTGFPPFRSGLMHYADDKGAEYIYQSILEKQKNIDEFRFKPAELLKTKALTKTKFYSA
ncbi:MAG: 3-hydroxyacyl-CoA dehydrogenase/enoyl-CoA hydratase/3-hydroxybutyryl-CoA epimerase [Candidatus Omnitrophota bacterium]|jgi:3-hydroxyacyl-CoA dehydrogenase/enoyl-CoA hydratase/3-hydroxybutyryl-CoA epimerase